MSEAIQRRTACNRDCPDACEMIATIEQGRVTRLQGVKDHPITQGFLCRRTSRFLDRQYASDRLTEPLFREDIGAPFRPVSWDEALDRVANKLLEFRQKDGAESILSYRCGGSMGLMKHVTDYFFQRFGPTTTKSGDVCSGAGEAAQLRDFGESDSNDFFDVERSRSITLWGKNVFVSNVHLIPQLRRLRAAGIPLTLIDPVRHRTCELVDLYLQPRPGGDAALACGVARWLLDHHHFDAAAPDYTDHWSDYCEMLKQNEVHEWAAAADVPVEKLERFAEIYGQSPSAILLGWGLQRRRTGAATVRAIDALATMAGNMGVSGGGVSFYYARRSGFDFSFAAGLAEGRKIPEPLLGEGILAAKDPPVRMVFITAANPVATLPDSHVVARALASREFTVVVDPFLTDTGRCAHLVLPTTTFLEEDDLLGAYGHHWMANMRAVTSPPEGVISDYHIIQRLAARVGMGDEFGEPVDAWKRRLMSRSAKHGVTLERLEQGATRNPFAPEVCFADRRFKTPSGRVNLLTSLPSEACQPIRESSVKLAALSTDRAQSSQWSPAEQEGPATIVVHPSVVPWARQGEIVTVQSSVGELDVRVDLDERQRPDVAVMDKGGWLFAERSANSLVPAEVTDDGECAVYYDTPVTFRARA